MLDSVGTNFSVKMPEEVCPLHETENSGSTLLRTHNYPSQDTRYHPTSLVLH